MNPKVKLTAYAVLILLGALFAHGLYSNYTIVTAAADGGPSPPAATPDDTANSNSENSNTTGTNVTSATPTDTNAAAGSVTNTASTDANVAAQPQTTDTNAAASTDTNLVATTATNAVANTQTNKANAKKRKHKVLAKAASPSDVSQARKSLMTYLGAFVGAMIGLGLLVAYDVTQFAGTQAVDFLFNDAGDGQRDPEYERAEQEWANGKHLEAIQLMRDYLKKHPREIYAALRIAEIYEKDLRNYLAAALEYEEILKNKLPNERWGWVAIHLCNLYSKLNKSEQAVALLRRIADEYPRTAAAKKARVRLGIAEPEYGEAPEEVIAQAEPDPTADQSVIVMEERPPELEPGHKFPSPREEAAATDESAAPKPGLPPGFRKKK